MAPQDRPRASQDRVGQLIARWEAVDGGDDGRWKLARRTAAMAYVVEQLGVTGVSLDPGTVAYLEWLADWDAPTIVDTIAYIEFLAGRHGAGLTDASSYLDWLSRCDVPTVAATVRLAQLARQASKPA